MSSIIIRTISGTTPFRIRHKVAWHALYQKSVLGNGLQRPRHALLGVVHARRFALAVHVGKDQDLDLAQLLQADEHGRAHDKPGEGVARRFRGAAVVAKEVERG